MSSVKKYSAVESKSQENTRETYQINRHKLIGGVAKGPLQNDLEMTFCHAILLSVPCNFHKNIKSFRKIQTVKHFLAIGTGIVISCDLTKAVFFQMRSFFWWLLQNVFFFDPQTKTEGASQHTSEDSINSFSGSSRKTHFEGSIPDTNVKPYYHCNIVPADYHLRKDTKFGSCIFLIAEKIKKTSAIRTLHAPPG